MTHKVQHLRKFRRYSEEFKRSLVSDYEQGLYSVLQLSRLHKVPVQTIYRWIYKFSTFNDKSYRIVEMADSSSKKVKELEARIKELEGMVGRKQIMIDYLDKMMDIAKDELDIDIKKNYGTPPSNGSENTAKD